MQSLARRGHPLGEVRILPLGPSGSRFLRSCAFELGLLVCKRALLCLCARVLVSPALYASLHALPRRRRLLRLLSCRMRCGGRLGLRKGVSPFLRSACASYRPWECKTWPLQSSSPCAPPVPLDAASERLLLLSCMCHAAVVCACSAVGVQGPENCRRLLRSLRGSGGPKAGLWALGRPGCLLAQEATGAFPRSHFVQAAFGGRLGLR